MKDSRELAGRRSAPLFFKHVIRKIFLEDWLLKLTALLITLALWYGVSVSSKKGTATFSKVPLAFRVADDKVLMSAGVQDVTISVSGNDKLIGQLYGSNDLRITADLTESETGDHILQLSPQGVSTNLPVGIKLEDVQPNRIAVKLEMLVQKDLPVEAATTGEPASGYEIYSTVVTPSRARVSGPESFMETITSVPTESVDIGGAKSDISRQVAINLNNPRVTVSNTVFDVNISVGEKRVERMFVLTTANNKRINAMLFGPKSVIAKLKPADLKADAIKGENGIDVPQLILPESARPSVEIRDLKIH